MTVVLGAANAFLGLHAGMTIAATYPAAVMGVAVLRGFKGTVLRRKYRAQRDDRRIGGRGRDLYAPRS